MTAKPSTLPLVGYANRLSVRPGESISFHVATATSTTNACHDGGEVKVSLRRVVSADPNPQGPGIQLRVVPNADIIQVAPPAPQSIPMGSHAEIHLAPWSSSLSLSSTGMTFAVTILPTKTAEAGLWQTVASIPMGTRRRVHFVLDDRNRLGIQEQTLQSPSSSSSSATSSNNMMVKVTKSLPLHHWATVWCQITPATAEITWRVGWQPVRDATTRTATTTTRTTYQPQYAGYQASTDTSPIPQPEILEENDQQTSLESSTLLVLAAQPLIKTKDANHDTSTYFDFHFNGRMQDPKLWRCAVNMTESTTNDDHIDSMSSILLETAADATNDWPPPDAAWDFGLQMDTAHIIDVGPHQCHGRLVNLPTRAVKSATWTGHHFCYTHPDCPRHEYSAIHFHETDLVDCQWPVTHTWQVPHDFPSGVYALWLEQQQPLSDAGNDDEPMIVHDNIPFAVVPTLPTEREHSKSKSNKVAVILPTFTYVIYGNHARSEWMNNQEWRQAWKHQMSNTWKAHGAYPHHPCQHPEYGWSTYNRHADGTGIGLASWHRPLLTMRVGYVTFPFPHVHGSGLRHFAADTHLLTWLEQQQVDYDVITDWELHTNGAAVLQPYRVVLTTSHPEYHSYQSLQALQDYRDQWGGRLMYLGGNGFYWKIAVANHHNSSHDGIPTGVLEIRRAEGGVRAWASEPGEYYHQLDGGGYGGLWRNNGRPPQALVGVGFSAQGIFVGTGYKVEREATTNPRTAWMFQGVVNMRMVTDNEEQWVIGNHGLSGHGAAGFELDRADHKLGTPHHAVVVACSCDVSQTAVSSSWILVFEERLTHLGNLVGVPDQELMRADMVFFETASGGAVFSVGSITFCGSLLTSNAGGDNDISKLTGNVLHRFMDPNVTFTVPTEEED